MRGTLKSNLKFVEIKSMFLLSTWKVPYKTNQKVVHEKGTSINSSSLRGLFQNSSTNPKSNMRINGAVQLSFGSMNSAKLLVFTEKKLARQAGPTPHPTISEASTWSASTGASIAFRKPAALSECVELRDATTNPSPLGLRWRFVEGYQCARPSWRGFLR